MNHLFYSKKNIYLFVSVVLVFVLSAILILQDIKTVTVNELIDNGENLYSFDYKDMLIEGEYDIKLIETYGQEGVDVVLLDTSTYEEVKRPNESSTKNNLAPINSERYIVSRGDTLYLIASRSSMTVEELKSINNLAQVDTIYEGQVLHTISNGNENNNSDNSSSPSSREDDIYWLSRIIHAEAQGEPYEGKVAVGNVVLNRVAHRDFPNTIRGVIYDKQYGYVQFSPVLDGSINNTPNEESRRAAIDALDGYRPVGTALYFLNPRKATNFWIVHNRRYFMTIGDHDFYY
ncbi:cell wall hydrolase [Serpentinicella alkaliphila]|uniref:N-acetylmuramoyl-L-alanine amidase n=1 Tax=Serpentinicella alkaliphila TaxID=1734049 RepID=A0A4R2TER6_9FIRM|nr:cell wall hydrolase [Serpentinicella alkaliphila]TCQ00567.1 N-acetylmuramoyl-L-alanine amidase [Serpentinicella alkaliphila]